MLLCTFLLNTAQARNVSIPGVEPYPDLASLPERFKRHGFTTSLAMTLRDIRRSCICAAELERCALSPKRNSVSLTQSCRISHLEMLDEIEELELVLEHYAITWGVKLSDHEAQSPWINWGLLHT